MDRAGRRGIAHRGHRPEPLREPSQSLRCACHRPEPRDATRGRNAAARRQAADDLGRRRLRSSPGRPPEPPIVSILAGTTLATLSRGLSARRRIWSGPCRTSPLRSAAESRASWLRVFSPNAVRDPRRPLARSRRRTGRVASPGDRGRRGDGGLGLRPRLCLSPGGSARAGPASDSVSRRISPARLARATVEGARRADVPQRPRRRRPNIAGRP